MRTEALLLLKDKFAQRLAATWDTEIAETEESLRIAAWATAAGIGTGVARVHGPPLIRAGICLPNGTIDPLAEQYLQKKVREDLGI